jgi:hypothetical protein
MKIVGETDLGWSHIDILFSKKLDKRAKESQGQPMTIEATIYDLIVEVKKNNQQAMRMIDFINKLFEELSLNLKKNEKKLIKRNIRSFLTTLDKGYLNFLGEIAVLNNLLKSKLYELEDVETQLPNNKTIDFKLRKLKDDNSILVEVVNIHLDSERIEYKNKKIEKFLTERFEKKIESKKMGLEDDIDFYLIPVLWGTWKDLKVYSDYFKDNEIHIQNVAEPVSYLTFIDPNNEYFYLHRFGRVSNLFNNK